MSKEECGTLEVKTNMKQWMVRFLMMVLCKDDAQLRPDSVWGSSKACGEVSESLRQIMIDYSVRNTQYGSGIGEHRDI